MAARTTYGIVAGVGKCGTIGVNQALPWSLKKDLVHFASLTKPGTVIMGRKTYESLPPAVSPLPSRTNIVLSTSLLHPPAPDVILARSLPEALSLVAAHALPSPVSVIGGASLYAAALDDEDCTWAELTLVDLDVAEESAGEEDEITRFPAPLPLDGPGGFFHRVSSDGPHEENGVGFEFVRYERTKAPNLGEKGYLDLVRRVIDEGVVRADRTGVGTVALFGESLSFDLGKGFPLLTTKRVFWRGVAEELLWFVSGSTNANLLAEKNIRIWDGNSSREYLDSIGLEDREVGDLGPVYGFQWRHFGAEYSDMHADYTGAGVDQLQNIIDTIRTKPHDRRMIMSAWNPAALHLMALPPCHMFCQFFVADGKLSCQMYQRSCDLGLGVPFNIASYALLTHMVARVTDLDVGTLTLVLGDAHVYSNHIEPLKRQLARSPRAFPSLRISRDTDQIDDFVFDDFEVVGYHPMKGIKMQMAV